MYTLISGSPKIQKSNSLTFLEKISKELGNYKIYELKRNKNIEILENMNKSEVLVLAYPLYVDSPTSIMLSFLDYIVDEKIDLQKKLVYVIVNCGFREGKQNITSVNVIKRWCEKVNANYMGSIMIGAGEIVGEKKYKYVSTKALNKLKQFSNIIKLKEKSDDIITTMDIINNKLYCHLANLFWNKRGKNNKLSNQDLEIE